MCKIGMANAAVLPVPVCAMAKTSSPFKIGGIALASSIAGSINFLFLYNALKKKLDWVKSGLIMFLLICQSLL